MAHAACNVCVVLWCCDTRAIYSCFTNAGQVGTKSRRAQVKACLPASDITNAASDAESEASNEAKPATQCSYMLPTIHQPPQMRAYTQHREVKACSERCGDEEAEAEAAQNRMLLEQTRTEYSRRQKCGHPLNRGMSTNTKQRHEPTH